MECLFDVRLWVFLIVTVVLVTSIVASVRYRYTEWRKRMLEDALKYVREYEINALNRELSDLRWQFKLVMNHLGLKIVQTQVTVVPAAVTPCGG